MKLIFLLVMSLMAITQKNRLRGLAVFLFVFFAVLHSALETFEFMNSGVYYISAALFNVVYIYSLSRFSTVNRLITDLQMVSFIALFINVYGFLSWSLYLPTDTYKQVFVVVYVLAMLAIFRRDLSDAERFSIFGFFGRSASDGGSWFKGIQLHSKNKG